MSSKKNINRRGFLGASGVVAASALGAGAIGLGASPAHADLRGAPREIENQGRILSYEFNTTSVETRWPHLHPPRATVLLPDGYHTSGKRYPVLYLLHGGLGSYMQFRDLGIEGLTAGKELIVVMPEGGYAGWYSNPASTSITVGPRNWETFHINELLPWVDATFRTHAEYAGRAVSGFSMGGFGALKYTAKYYGHFCSVSSHSGPASLREPFDAIRVADYINLTGFAECGRSMYGVPWREDLVSADNPVERIESYRNKRIFLVAGTARSALFNGKAEWNELQEQQVADGQRQFGALLDQAGIPHTRYEEPGGHFVRQHRLQEDIDGIVAHLKKAG
ncbi:twin-arginine translocation signal domain-containing protein [Arachnia propionica]|uniref:Acyl-CoA:diacylglycerol acyltransferase n=1 Tax=Arachnia propionica TaxID=1750 RepID=A0A3P1T715_9ACTN|nr:alpha/beta hydrolase family protein [Arachnia propionica]MDO5082704.1 alpha/beta hydrolase-fold protein [Arachnia propionica]RRD05184.1 twin-arginine translocation signal domain-containing protein [Arachnia propionica]